MTRPAQIPFQEVLDALLDGATRFNPRYLYRFSDLEPKELENLTESWSKIPIWRRKALMEDIEELNSRDNLLSFYSLACFAVSDEDQQVKLPSVRILWEYEEIELIPIFMDLLQNDRDVDVRAAAATALGRFIYAGELEEISPEQFEEIEELLLSIARGSDDLKVRCSALESLGYSSRPDVSAIVHEAYNSDNRERVASALVAMGRSRNEKWYEHIHQMLDSQFPRLRCEAARAAGELGISDASTPLLELLDDPDENTRLASIWSLSQIGGDGVDETLQRMYEEAVDEAEAEFIDSALDNLEFNEGLRRMTLLDFSEQSHFPLDEDFSIELMESDEDWEID